jgi:hypothetical protein
VLSICEVVTAFLGAGIEGRLGTGRGGKEREKKVRGRAELKRGEKKRKDQILLIPSGVFHNLFGFV